MELVSHLLRVPQPMSGPAGVGTQAIWLPSPHSQPYPILPLWSINSPFAWSRQIQLATYFCIFVDKGTLIHKHIHTFIVWLPNNNGRVEWMQPRPHGIQSIKHELSGPLQIKVAGSQPRTGNATCYVTPDKLLSCISISSSVKWACFGQFGELVYECTKCQNQSRWLTRVSWYHY